MSTTLRALLLAKSALLLIQLPPTTQIFLGLTLSATKSNFLFARARDVLILLCFVKSTSATGQFFFSLAPQLTSEFCCLLRVPGSIANNDHLFRELIASKCVQII